MASEQFLNEFWNLSGTLLKEKKKSLYLLLKQNEFLIDQKDVLGEIVAKLIPNTYLEEVFRIEVLIFYRRAQELLEVMKNGNDIFRSKIIKQAWFIRDITDQLTAEQFVKDFLPTLSYVVRLKILKNVIKFVSDEEKFDLIFDYLVDIYGISSALIVLPACSKNKIEREIKSRRINLTPSQLKILFEKDPNLLFVYFDRKKGVDWYEFRHSPVLKQMALTHPQLFVKFMDRFDVKYVKFGRETTKKFVDTMKEDIIKAPSKYSSFLRNDRLVRKLGDDFPRFFKNFVPLNKDGLVYSKAKFMLGYYFKCKQYDLYFNTFQEVYRKSLWDFPEHMNDDLLAKVPKQTDRNKWMEKLEKRKDYLKHYQVEKVSDCLMDMEEDEDCAFNCFEPERTKQFNVLIESIKLCESYDSLLDLLKFVCTRHRNTEANVLYDFLKSLNTNFDTKKLNNEHWKLIYDIFTILKFRKQKLYTPLLLKYIEFIHTSGNPIKDLVLLYMQENSKDFCINLLKNKAFNKELIKNYIDLSSHVNDLEVSLGINIIVNIMKWNKKNPDHKFSIFNQPALVIAVKNSTEDIRYRNSNKFKALQYVLCTQQKESCTEIEDLEKTYWESNIERDNVTRFYVKYKPEVLLKYCKKLAGLKYGKAVILNQIKKMHHLQLPQKIIRYYSEIMDKTPEDKKMSYIQIVSILNPSVEYFELVPKYYPSFDTTEIKKSDKEREFYNVQCDVAKNLKNITLRDTALSEVFLFLKGDYLKYALTSLYSLLDRTPENQVSKYLQNLDREAVSVKKHEIFLTCRLLSVQGVLKMYEHELKTNPHHSLQKHLLTGCYKYFKRNPTDGFWTLLKECLKFINGKDRESFGIISNLKCIPDQYKAEYFEIVWNIYEKFISVDTNIKQKEANFIESVERDDIKLLNWEFCSGVIRSKLFKKHVIDDTYLSFLIKCLLYTDNVEIKVDFVFEIFTNIKSTYFNSSEYKEVEKAIYNFCVEFYKEIMSAHDKTISADDKTISASRNVPKLFEERWFKHFSDIDTFDEHLMINFMLLKCESRGDLKIVSKGVAHLFNKMLMRYGDFIYAKFSDGLKHALGDLLRKENTSDADDGGDEKSNQIESELRRCKFVLSLVEFNDSVPFHCLGVDILPGKVYGEESKKMYKAIVDVLRTKEAVVQVYLASRLKQDSLE